MAKFSVIRKGCPIVFDMQFSMSDDGDFVADLGYGYESHWGKWCTEGKDSALPGNRYRIMHCTRPIEGDEITHTKSGRTFVVGEISGFVIYKAPLLENGRKVAVLKFEDYYKD